MARIHCRLLFTDLETGNVAMTCWFFRILVTSICVHPMAIAAEGPYIRVTASPAKIEVTENGRTRLVGTVQRGTRLWVLEVKGDYYRVTHPSTGQRGWLWKRHAESIQYSDAQLESHRQASEYWAEGNRLKESQDWADAEQAYRKALLRMRQLFGDTHPDSPGLQSEIAHVKYLSGDMDAAIPMFRTSAKLYRQVVGFDDPRTLEALQNLAYSYMDAGRLAEAEAPFEQLISELTAKHGANNRKVTDIKRDLATVRLDLGKWESAERLARSCLAADRELHGIESLEYCASLDILGRICGGQGRFEEAIELIGRAHQTMKRTLGPDHQGTLASLGNLAGAHHKNGDLTKALATSRQVLDLRRKALGTTDPDTLDAMNTLARIQLRLGDFSNAKSLCESAVFASEQRKHGVRKQRLTALSLRGTIAEVEGNALEAEQCFRRVLTEIRQLEKASYGTAGALNNLAGALSCQENYHEAKTLLNESLAIYRKLGGEANSNMIRPLHELSQIYEFENDYDQAELLIGKALSIARQKLGSSHPDALDLVVTAASQKYEAGRRDEAEVLLKEALPSISDVLGATHPLTATAKRFLGRLNCRKGNYEEAVEMYRGALQIREQRFGRAHLLTVQVLHDLSRLHIQSGQPTMAVDTFEQTMRAHSEYQSKVLPTLDDRARARFLEGNYSMLFADGLSFGLLHKGDPRVATISASWLLNFKAAPHVAIAEASLLSDPAVSEKVDELKGVRSRLAKISFTPAKDISRGTREELAALETKERALVQEIASQRRFTSGETRWITAGELMSSTPFESVFINIARFPQMDLTDEDAEAGTEVYAAWIIPSAGTGQIKVVPLGDAEEIDAEISGLREQFAATQLAKIKQEGEQAIVAEYQKAAARLSRLLLQPLEQYIDQAEEVVISPDSTLWTLPWQALLLSNGRYLIEDHRVRYVLSGRELVTAPKDRALVTPPVVFADPDYDLASSEIQVGDSAEDSRLRSALSLHFPRLPSTAVEAETLIPAIDTLTSQRSKLLVREEARESAFKNLHRPRVLVMSTHGFFKPSEQIGTDSSIQNPLLRCGLALAGANNERGRVVAGEDGILTGLEIIGTDLRGTELAILSACETGIGDVRSGEGVIGLRHAFQLAGAQSVVASLWQVEDKETARLVAAFTANVAKGIGKSESMQKAQLERIKTRRERNGAAHPFFWAAFTLTGQN